MTEQEQSFPDATGQQGSELDHGRPVQGPDGSYRWIHEVRLLTDTLLPATLIKICLLASLAPPLLLAFLSLIEGTFLRDYPAFIKVFAITAGILMGLCLIAYYLVFVPVMGGRYTVVFEMDEDGISHIEMPKKTDKMFVLNTLGVMAGIASGNLSVAGANLMAASRKRMYTGFKNVRKIILYRKKGAMKLVANDMTRNLIYAPSQDLERVYQMILERCPRGTRVKHK